MNGMEAYRSKIARVLITEDEIAEAMKKAGAWLEQLYDGKPLLLVGSFIFLRPRRGCS